MRTNISALMNSISETERNLNNICYNIKSYSFNTSIEELDGKVNIIEDNKADFDFNLNELEKSNSLKFFDLL